MDAEVIKQFTVTNAYVVRLYFTDSTYIHRAHKHVFRDGQKRGISNTPNWSLLSIKYLNIYVVIHVYLFIVKRKYKEYW